jgi:hypothetical protein
MVLSSRAITSSCLVPELSLNRIKRCQPAKTFILAQKLVGGSSVASSRASRRSSRFGTSKLRYRQRGHETIAVAILEATLDPVSPAG